LAKISDTLKNWMDVLMGPIEGGSDDPFSDLEKDFNDQPEYDGSAVREPAYKRNQERPLKVVPMANKGSYEVVVFEPRSYNESVTIVEALKERKTVILNLQLLDREQSQRIVDFLCGCTHALDGDQRKIGDSVFIFTPSNINLTQEMANSALARDARWNQTQTL